MRADSDIFCMAVWWTGAAGGLADELLFRLGERVDLRLKVLFVVRGAHLGPYPRSAVGDNRVEEADHVDALLQHPRREALREGGVAEHDGHDRVRACLDREARAGEAVAEHPRVAVEPVPELRGAADQVEGGESAARCDMLLACCRRPE